MRVLLAIDGSDSANRARDLVAGIAWPTGTIIRVVAALQEGPELAGLPWLAATPSNASEVEASLIRRLNDALETAIRDIGRPGLAVERLLLRGRPASAIVDEAREWGADLIAVGHRGLGTIETMLLGSVSAEVVDHAPCPVLVARRPEVRSVIFATDGSTCAGHAEEVLTAWPMFADLPVTVVSVADTALPWSVGMAPGLYDRVVESYTEDVDEARREGKGIADAAAVRLIEHGLIAVAEVHEGDPAATIVATAIAKGTDLVVIGTRGHTGLARLLLGSVARNVLVHAPSSVLVVREKARVAHIEPEKVATTA
jgi:nucleotide-binding universal stress UspA family protein